MGADGHPVPNDVGNKTRQRMYILSRMAHLSTIFGMVGSSDMIHFGSLEFPMLPLVGMWAPPVFMPL